MTIETVLRWEILSKLNASPSCGAGEYLTLGIWELDDQKDELIFSCDVVSYTEGGGWELGFSTVNFIVACALLDNLPKLDVNFYLTTS